MYHSKIKSLRIKTGDEEKVTSRFVRQTSKEIKGGKSG